MGSNFAGATLVVDGRAARAIAESVHIRSVGGFTGMYSQGAGDAATLASTAALTWSLARPTALLPRNPTEPTTADFKISAKC